MDPSCRLSSSCSPCLCLITNINIAADRRHGSVVVAVRSEVAAIRKAQLRVTTPQVTDCLFYSDTFQLVAFLSETFWLKMSII